MEIHCLGSGSSGNCFILKNGEDVVLLECGFDYRKIITKLLDYGISFRNIKAVICSHLHKDHSKAFGEFANYGYQVYAPESVYEELNIQKSILTNEKTNTHIISQGSNFRVLEWLSIAFFDLSHDAPCYGMCLHDTKNDTLTLFIPDTGYFELPYKFQYDYIYIECNHIRKALDKAIEKDPTNKKYIRQGQFHLSLKGTKAILRQLDLSKCKEITLMHFSKEFGYPQKCRDDIAKTFGIKTNVC